VTIITAARSAAAARFVLARRAVAFAFAVAVAFADEALKEDSSRTSIRTRGESLRTRCLMVSDEDELGLLSKARPLTAKPLSAVTQTRDGFVCNKICSAFLALPG
jgi:hypothetical protein